MRYALCADIGTTSLKAAVISQTGKVVFNTKIQFSREDPFIALASYQALRDVFFQINKNQKLSALSIDAISVSGNGPTVCTQSGLTFLWNAPLLESAKSEFSSIDSPSLFLPRIIGLKHAFPSEYSDSPMIFSGPEFLIYKLTGNALTILPDSRYKTAYWTQEQLKKCDIPPQKLPPFANIAQSCGFLSKEAMDFLSIKKSLPVFSAGPDFVAALIGTDTLSPGKLCDRCGSSEGINLCIDRPLFFEGLRTLPSVIPDLWNISALIPDSGALSEKEHLDAIKSAFLCLKEFSAANGIAFPSKMSASGGQLKNTELTQKKASLTGISIEFNNKTDAELIGDAAAAFTGLGVYKNIQEAARALLKNKSNISIIKGIKNEAL